MPVAEVQVARSRKRLMLRDGLTFLGLLAVSLALFAVTMALFGSFEQHRAELSRTWSERGRLALEHGHATEAVDALHVALTYTAPGPKWSADELLLARALALSGHLNEARSYFLNLWEARPGDGEVNLQLARLARQQGKLAEAAEYYRLSVNGSWESEGIVHRRAVRLELSDFLASRGEDAEARDELMTVAGNATNDKATLLGVAERFDRAGDLPDALTFYVKAGKLPPFDPVSLARAREIAAKLATAPVSPISGKGEPDGR